METQTRVVVEGVAESGYSWLHSEDSAEIISWRLIYEGEEKPTIFPGLLA